MTNRNNHRGSLNLSVFCSSQTRVFIQVEQVLQFLKDGFSEAVTKTNYHNHLAQEGTKSIKYYISRPVGLKNILQMEQITSLVTKQNNLINHL